MPPRRIEVESKIASSILDEKLADSIRKYTVLFDKRCADKLTKTLAWKDFAKDPRDKKTVCFTMKNINSKYNQISWIFTVALNRYFFRPSSTLYWKTTKSRLTEAKLYFWPPSWKKFDCPWLPLRILPSLRLSLTYERRLLLHLHLRRTCEPGFKAVHTSCPSTVLTSNVNTPFFIIHTIIGVRHQSPSTKSRPCTPALKWALGPDWVLQASFFTYPYFFTRLVSNPIFVPSFLPQRCSSTINLKCQLKTWSCFIPPPFPALCLDPFRLRPLHLSI